jgi:hypothetical protein
MINFIPGVPHYEIASMCTVCRIWWPKNSLINCPCCSRRLRTKSRRQRTYVNNYTQEEINQIIKDKIEKEGWKIIKTLNN